MEYVRILPKKLVPEVFIEDKEIVVADKGIIVFGGLEILFEEVLKSLEEVSDILILPVRDVLMALPTKHDRVIGAVGFAAEIMVKLEARSSITIRATVKTCVAIKEKIPHFQRKRVAKLHDFLGRP